MRGALTKDQMALVMVDMSYHDDWREAGVLDLMVAVVFYKPHESRFN